MRIMFSEGGGWDHVSISFPTRCPTWEEMCKVKDMFFRRDEVAMQLHPAEAEYVNYHPFCLHLWRPQTAEEIAQVKADWEETGEPYPYGELQSPGAIPTPDSIMVGPKQKAS